jgi:plastocyanin
MMNNQFQPGQIQVPVRTTVTWTNAEQTPHNVKFDDGPSSDNLAFGATFQRVFNDAGTFDYVCTIHTGMVGRVTVVSR